VAGACPGHRAPGAWKGRTRRSPTGSGTALEAPTARLDLRGRRTHGPQRTPNSTTLDSYLAPGHGATVISAGEEVTGAAVADIGVIPAGALVGVGAIRFGVGAWVGTIRFGAGAGIPSGLGPHTGTARGGVTTILRTLTRMATN